MPRNFSIFKPIINLTESICNASSSLFQSIMPKWRFSSERNNQAKRTPPPSSPFDNTSIPSTSSRQHTKSPGLFRRLYDAISKKLVAVKHSIFGVKGSSGERCDLLEGHLVSEHLSAASHGFSYGSRGPTTNPDFVDEEGGGLSSSHDINAREKKFDLPKPSAPENPKLHPDAPLGTTKWRYLHGFTFRQPNNEGMSSATTGGVLPPASNPSYVDVGDDEHPLTQQLTQQQNCYRFT